MSPFGKPFTLKSIDHGFILAPILPAEQPTIGTEGTPAKFTLKEDHLESGGTILTRELSNHRVGFIRMLFLPPHLHSGGIMSLRRLVVGKGIMMVRGKRSCIGLSMIRVCFYLCPFGL